MIPESPISLKITIHAQQKHSHHNALPLRRSMEGVWVQEMDPWQASGHRARPDRAAASRRTAHRARADRTGYLRQLPAPVNRPASGAAHQDKMPYPMASHDLFRSGDQAIRRSGSVSPPARTDHAAGSGTRPVVSTPPPGTGPRSASIRLTWYSWWATYRIESKNTAIFLPLCQVRPARRCKVPRRPRGHRLPTGDHKPQALTGGSHELTDGPPARCA